MISTLAKSITCAQAGVTTAAEASPSKSHADFIFGSPVLFRRPSLLRRLEISQIGRRLILLGRHQNPVAAEEIVFLAEDDLAVALGDVILRPVRARVLAAHVFLVDRPRARQGVVDGGELVVH